MTVVEFASFPGRAYMRNQFALQLSEASFVSRTSYQYLTRPASSTHGAVFVPASSQMAAFARTAGGISGVAAGIEPPELSSSVPLWTSTARSPRVQTLPTGSVHVPPPVFATPSDALDMRHGPTSVSLAPACTNTFVSQFDGSTDSAYAGKTASENAPHAINAHSRLRSFVHLSISLFSCSFAVGHNAPFQKTPI